MKKELPSDPPLLDAEEAYMETVRKAAECRHNDAVICGLYQKDPERCACCNWNPNKGKGPAAP
jgi:hypothetical protein